MVRGLIAFIRLYQWCVSPLLASLLGASCRFSPTCSEYAIVAIRKHGAVTGVGFAIRRILRCQPFCHGGLDPVP